MTMTEDVPGVELAVRAQPMLPMPAAEAKQVMQAYQDTCRAILTPDDVQRVGDRDFTKRSGFQKLAAAYGVSTELVSLDVKGVGVEEDPMVARAVVRAIHPSGRHAEGDGACSSGEKRFRKGDEKIDHSLPATAVTRATNRAVSNLVAFGSVSAEEAEASTPAGAPGLPAWASPVTDVGGVAATLTVLLAELGVTEPDRAAMKLGQTIFDGCGDSIPVCVARVIEHIAAAERAPHEAKLKAWKQSQAPRVKTEYDALNQTDTQEAPAGAAPVDAEATEEPPAAETTIETQEKPA